MCLGFPSTSTIASIRRRVSGYQTQVRCPVSLMTTSRRILSLGALCCPTTSYFIILSLARMIQKTPRWKSRQRCLKSTYALSKMTISPSLTPSQSAGASAESCVPAVFTRMKFGRKERKSRRKCIFAAAFRLQCFAQSRQLAISWIVVESTTWIIRLKRLGNAQ